MLCLINLANPRFSHALISHCRSFGPSSHAAGIPAESTLALQRQQSREAGSTWLADRNYVSRHPERGAWGVIAPPCNTITTIDPCCLPSAYLCNPVECLTIKLNSPMPYSRARPLGKFLQLCMPLKGRMKRAALAAPFLPTCARSREAVCHKESSITIQCPLEEGRPQITCCCVKECHPCRGHERHIG